MRKILAGAACALVACSGSSQPAATAGPGITLTNNQIAIDGTKVPFVPACAAGQVLQKSADGWACVAQGTLAAGSADNAAKLGGHAPADFLGATATAANSAQLGGQTYSQLNDHWVQIGPSAPQAGSLAVTGDVAVNGKFRGDGSALTGLTADAIIAGLLDDSHLSANVARLNAAQTFSGAVTLSNATVTGTLSGTVSGDGSGLTRLTAASLVGTIANANLAANVCRLDGTSATFAGAVAATKFTGDGSGLTGVNLQPAKDYADQRLAAGVAVASSVATAASDPSTCTPGAMYFNTTTNSLRVCNGSSFVSVFAGTLAGPNPGESKKVFTYAGGDQVFTVPAGVTSITAKLWGAGGGGQELVAGGAGGYTTGTFAVTPGDTLTVIVGGGGRASGAGGYGGGGSGGSFATQGAGGGGRSAIRRGSVELLTAGAGGGATNHGVNAGGNGGGFNGSTGQLFQGSVSGPAQGGTQTAGGAGGTGGYGGAGGAGSQFQGGNGVTEGSTYGAGGGGGWYGGGGGSTNGSGPIYASGGGGGSGHYADGVTNAATLGSAGPNPITVGVVLPPNVGDPDYRSGAGTASGIRADGNPGLVVLAWGGAQPQPPSLTTNGSHSAAVFNCTTTDQQFNVPSGVGAIRVKAWGAAGGSNGVIGGPGGFTNAIVAVNPGELLNVIVGCGGTSSGSGPSYGGGGAGGFVPATGAGSTGSSGGGRSALRRNSVELLTAGGGGGSQWWAGGVTGGAGGGATGGIGSTNNGGTEYVGAGGTQTAGGHGGFCGNLSGVNSFGESGTQFTGGNGANTANYVGGGGGGGYFGGGGGAGNCSSGGPTSGGGGSGFAAGPGVFGNVYGGESVISPSASSAAPPGNSDPDYGGLAGVATLSRDGYGGRVVIAW